MTIVSISGLIGSGKDTVSDYLVTMHGFRRESFAGTLKDAVAAVFSWDRDMLEGKTAEARAEREKVDHWWAKKLNMPHLTPRWVLQYWGTDVCRAGFHDDIWIASLERKLEQMRQSDIVISDVRFVNELDMLSNAGAITVCVTRGSNPVWWDIAQQAQYDANAVQTMSSLGVHRSEWDWVGCNFDVELNNDGTKDDLYNLVDTKILKNLEIA